MLVAAVDHETLLNLHVNLSSLRNQQSVAARVLQPCEPEIVQDLDVALL